MRHFLFGLLTVLFLMSAIETGVRARACFERNQRQRLSENKIRIALVGDSVMGLGTEQSVGRHIERKLTIRALNQFEITNLSKPMNRSHRVADQIEDVIRDYKPDLLIFMLGKSDWVDAETNIVSSNFHEWFSNFGLYRLFMLNWLSVERVWAEAKSAFFSEVHLARFQSFSTQSEVDQLEALDVNFNQEEISKQLAHAIEIVAPTSDESAKCYLKAYNLRIASHLGKMESQDLDLAEACFAAVKRKKIAPRRLAQIATRLGIFHSFRHEWTAAEKHFNDAIEKDPQYARAYIEMAWMFSAQQNVRMAMNYFEKAFELQDDFPRRSILNLFSCYVATREHLRGREFLLQRSNVSRERDLLRSLVFTLDRVSQERDFRSSFERTLSGKLLPETKKILGDETKDHDMYKAKMWHYKLRGDFFHANILFQNIRTMKPSASFHLNQNDFRMAIQKALDQNIRVLAVQYADEPDWTMKQAIDPFGEAVAFLSLHDSLVENLRNNPEAKAYDFFDYDLEHLSELGARVTGQAIGEKIVQLMSDSGRIN